MRNMSMIEDKKWKDFYLMEFFHCEKGNQNNMSSLSEGEIPLVSARKCDNGYKDFVAPNNKSLFEGGILSLNNDGDGGAGIAYYQPHKMALDSHVTALIPKLELNRHQLLFVSMCITKQRSRFGHGYSLKSNRLRSFKLMLPTSQSGQPDWQFMENYMKRIESDILDNSLSFFKDRSKYNNLLINKLGVKWSEFYLRDLFPRMEAGKSKGLNHLERDDLGISYLGATNLNNGVLCFVKAVDNLIQKGNCIAFIRNGEGSMGYSVYKAEDFIATSDMTLAYSEHINKYTGMFITTIADRIRGKYNFGYKRSATRLAKEVLSLPVTDSGKPDWQFMEEYMRNVESRIIVRYLERKKSFLEKILIFNSAMSEK